MIKSVDIPGLSHYTCCSVCGQVYRQYKSGLRKVKGSLNHAGYVKVTLYYLDKTKRRIIVRRARLVLSTFLGERNLFACHKNDVRDDDRLENLYWGTKEENERDKILHANTRIKLRQTDIFSNLSHDDNLPF